MRLYPVCIAVFFVVFAALGFDAYAQDIGFPSPSGSSDEGDGQSNMSPTFFSAGTVQIRYNHLITGELIYDLGRSLRTIDIISDKPLIGSPRTNQFTVPGNPVLTASLHDSNIRLEVSHPISDDSQTVSYAGNTITDAAGNPLEPFSDKMIDANVSDTLEPDAFILSTTNDGARTRSTTTSYTVVFTEAVPDFAISDITVGGTAAVGESPVSNLVNSDTVRYTFDVTVTGDGTLQVSIAAGATTDAADNYNTASNVYTVTVDTQLLFTSAETTDASTITVTADDQLEGTAENKDFAVSRNKVFNVEISGNTVILTVETPITSGDTPTVSYTGNTITDDLGNSLATFDEQTVSNDLSNLPLTVSITVTDTPDGGTHTSETVPYTVTFNKVVADFIESDISLTGTVSRGSPTISGFTGSGNVYTFNVVATSGGTLVVSIPAGVATDEDTYTNTASNTHTITLDIFIPIAVHFNSIGRSGSGDSEFNSPRGVAVNDSHILVADTGNDRVQIFNIAGSYEDQFGTTFIRPLGFTGPPPAGTFSHLRGITVTPDNILVADSNNDRIQIFDLQGDDPIAFGGLGEANGRFNLPSGITANSTHIIVADTRTHRIQVFDMDGDFVSKFGGIGTVNNRFNLPGGVAVTPTNIIVADTGNNRVTVYDLDGNYLSKFGRGGSGDTQFSSPTGVAATSTHIIVADTGNNRIQVFDLDGNYVYTIGSAGTGRAQFSGPTAIALTSTHMVVADTGNNRVQILDLAPTVTITTTTPDGGIHNFNTISYTVTFNESVTGFDVTDIIISGTASDGMPAISNFAGNGATYTFDVVTTSDGTVTVFIHQFTAVDNSGQDNLASNQYTVNVMDIPTVTGVSAARDTHVPDDIVDITITFDESVTVSGTPQLLLETGDTDAVADYLSGSPGTDLTFRYTVAVGHLSDDLNYVDTGSLRLNSGTIFTTSDTTVPAGLLLPATDSLNSLAGSSDVIVTSPLSVVSLSDTVTGGTGIITSSNTVSYAVTFSASVTDFIESDIVVSGTAAAASGGTLEASNLAGTGGTSYTFDVVSTGDGTVLVTIPAGVTTDAAGNGNTASDTHTVIVDVDPLTVTISGSTPDDNLQTGDTVSYTATFSEDVTDFVESDIRVTGTASGGTPATSNFVEISATVYTFDVVTTSDGTVLVTIPADVTTDAAGNGNVVSATYTVTADTTAPVLSYVVIFDANTIVFTASEPLEGTVTADDFEVSGNTISGTPEISDSTVTITVGTTIPNGGTVTINYRGNTITDLAGNALARFDARSVTDTGPTVTLTNDDTINNRDTNSNTLSYTAVFSKPVTGFDVSDITVTGSASVGTPAASNFVATSGTVYTFDVVTTSDGTVKVTIPAGVAADIAANDNTASNTYTVTVDTVSPTVTLTADTRVGGTHRSNTISYTATFSESMRNFDISDIVVTGTASDNSPVVSNFVIDHTTVYMFGVATTSDGTVIVTIPAGAATDAAGNGNTASDPYTITVDSTMVAVTIDSPTPNGNSQNSNTISYTSIFSEGVTGFAESGITVTGSASNGAPATSNFEEISATAYTFDVVTTSDGTVTVTIPADAAMVPAGKTLTASDPYTVTVDTVQPLFLYAETTDASTITVTADDTLEGTAENRDFAVSSNKVFNVEISGNTVILTVETPITSGDTPTVSYNGGTITDAAGNALATFDAQTVSNDLSNLSLVVGVTVDGTPNGGIHTSKIASYTVTFNKVVADFIESDISLTGTASRGLPTISDFAGSGNVYTFEVDVTGDGTLIVSIPAGVATDEEANTNTASDTHTITLYVFIPVAIFSHHVDKPDSFNSPLGVAANSTHVLVADSNRNRIQIFDISGKFVSEISDTVLFSTDAGGFSNPRGIAVTHTNILVADSNNGRIQVFDLDGDFVSHFGSRGSEPGQFHSPSGITTNSTHILVADTLNNRIHVFDMDGKFVSHFGRVGTPNGLFNLPGGVEVTPTNILVADTNNNRIQVFDLDGNYLRKFGSAGSGDSRFNFPLGIAATPANILVADTNNNRIQVFDLDGNYVHTIGSKGEESSQFNTPSDVSVSSTHMVVADRFNNRISVFDLAPTVAITTNTSNGRIHNSYTVSFTATFNESVTGFDMTDVIVSGTASGGSPAVSNFAGTGETYTFDVVATSDGTVTVSIPKLAAIDTVGNFSMESAAYAVTVSDAAPVVTGVSATGGLYTAGGTVDITVTFDESVTVTGIPQLLLETGTTDAVVDYTSGSDTTTLTFIYTVAATHNSDDLSYVDTGSLSLNGGTITTATADRSPASLTLPTITAATSLAGSSAVIVDTMQPTVTITNTQTTVDGDTATTRTLTYTAEFSETVTDFDDADDITVSGTATPTAETLTGSGTRYDFTVTATADGTVTVSIPAGAAADTATNGNVASAPYTVTVDTSPPTVTLASDTPDGGIQNTDTISYTATFSKEVIDFTLSDIMVDGTAFVDMPAASNFEEISVTVYTFDVVTTRDGTVMVAIPEDVTTDTATNANMASAPYTVTVDTAAPVVTLFAGTLHGGTQDTDTISYTATFSEGVTDFDESGIIITGTASGGTPATSNFEEISATVYTFDVVTTSDGTVIVTIPAGAATDAATNANAASDPYTVTVDTTAPVFSSVVIFDANTIVFAASEPLAGTVIADDFEVSDNTISVDPVISGSTVTITVGTAIPGGDTVTINYTGKTITDVVGNTLGTFDARPVTNTVPTVTLTNDDTTDGGATNSNTLSYTAEFSEHVTGFEFSDIMVTGTASGGTPAASNFEKISATVYTFDVVVTSDGTVIVTIPAGAATDAATNANVASAPYTVTVDTAAPVVTLSAGTHDGGTQNGNTVSYTATFDKDVTGFELSDITVTGTASVNVPAASNFGEISPTMYTFDVVVTSDGTVIVAIPADVAADIITNANAASAPYTVTVDTTAPVFSSVVIFDANTIIFTASEPLAGTVVAKDFAVFDNDISGAPVISGSTVTITVGTAIPGGDTVTINYTGKTITDVVGNALGTFDARPVTNTVPTVTLTNDDTTDGGVTNSNTLSYTAEFSEHVTGFEFSDIMVTGTASGGTPAASNFEKISVTVYTFDVVTTRDGTVIVAIPEGVTTDTATNGNVASAPYTVTVDTAAPVVTLSAGTHDGGTQNGNTVSYTATFDKDVTDFAESDVIVTETASGGTPVVSNFAAASATVYTFDVATTGDGTVTVTIPAGAAKDAAGNGNTASATHTVTVDTTGPVFISATTAFVSDVTATATTIVLTASEPLVGTATARDFTVSDNMVSDNMVSDVSVTSDNAVILTVGTPITGGSTITVGYSGGALTDGIGNPIVTFDSLDVTNTVPVATAPTIVSVSATGGTYSMGEIINITVTFDQPVTVSGTPQLTLDIGTTDAVVDYAAGSPGSAIIFQYTVTAMHNSDDLNYVDTTSLSLNGGSIVGTVGNTSAVLSLPATTDAKSLGGSNIVVDIIPPVFSSVTVPNAFTIIFTASEPLAGTVVAKDFAVSGNTISGNPVISGRTVTIALSTLIPSGGTVRIDYTGDKITDVAGNTLATFERQPATNIVPTVIITNTVTDDGGTTNSTILSYTAVFNELVTGFGDRASDITVTGAATASFPTGTGTTYHFTVTASADGPVSVSIPKNAVIDRGGNLNRASATHTVTVDTVAPVFTSAATVAATTIVLTASEPLVGTMDADDFGLAGNNTIAADPVISDNTITLTVGTAIVFGGTPVVSYFGTAITDVAGNALAPVTLPSVTNNVPDPDKPTVIDVYATGGSYKAGDIIDVTVTFDEIVTVDGTPQLTLETGTDDDDDDNAVADYATGSPGTDIIFRYTVAATHNSDDLDYVSIHALSLNGGTIMTRGDNMVANLVLPAIASAESLGGSSDVIVDSIVPTVAIITGEAANGGTSISDVLSYTATFSEAVTDFDAISDITLIGTANATVSAPSGAGETYTFVVTATTDGTVIVSIPAGAAADTAENGNTASGTYAVTVRNLSQTDPVDLPDNGYRHNLTHLTGNYYVSSHTVTAPDTTPTQLDSAVTLRLYSIIDGIIKPIGSQVIQNNSQDRTTTLHELATEPKSTGLTRIDDDTIAVSYVVGSTSSTIATYDVDTVFTPHFVELHSADFRAGTNGEQTHNHSLITFDENRLVLAYSYPDSTHAGFIQIITVDPDNGDLNAETPVAITANQGLYNSIVKLDDDTVVLGYSGAYAWGFIQAFDISTNSTITAGPAVQHEPARTAYHSLIRVDGDTVAVAYSAIGDSTSTSDGNGRLKVFDVASNGSITKRGSQVYYNDAANAAFEGQVHLNSLELLDSTLVLAYRGADGDGFIRLYDINRNTGGLTVIGEPYEHDTADGAFNSLLKIDDDTLALVYGGDLPGIIQDSTTTPNRIKTFTVIVPDTTPPVIESVEITDDTTIVITASESLAGTAVLEDFAVSDNTISGDPVISDNIITITVGMAIPSGGTVTVNYTGDTITDVIGNTLAMLTDLSVTNRISSDIAPNVTDVSAEGGSYNADDTIDIIITFDESVTVYNFPQLLLETGIDDATANYIRGSPGTVLTFQYAVAAGHISDDLNYVGINSLTLNGGDIFATDDRTPAILTLPALISADSLAGSDVMVDAVAPAVTITAEIPSGRIHRSETVSYTATFTEDVKGFAESDIRVTGTASDGLPVPSNFAGTGGTYTFDVVVTSDGTVNVSILPHMATDAAGNPNTASNIHVITVDTSLTSIYDLSQRHSVRLPDNGYRHNLVHLGGDYYASSHTVITPVSLPYADLRSIVTIRLYSIVDGEITLITNRGLTYDSAGNVDTSRKETQEPRSTGLARVDDDTVAISYTSAGISTVRTLDINTGPAGGITLVDDKILNFQLTGATNNHSLIALDENRLVLAYSQPDSRSNGLLHIITIPATGTVLTDSGVTTITTAQGRYPSVVKLDDDTVVLAYRSNSAQANIRAVDISADNVVSPQDAVNFDPGQRTAYNSLIVVDSDTVALAYSRIGINNNLGDGDGRLHTFDVASSGTITAMDSAVYYNAAETATSEERTHLSSLALLNPDTIAIAYRGTDGNGFIRLYDVDRADGTLTANSTPFEHDTADGAFNSLLGIDDDTLVLVYGGDIPGIIQDSTTTPNRIKTLTAIVQDTTPPVIESAATTDDITIVITAESLAGTAAAKDFAVSDNTISGDPVISDNIITITVGMAIAVRLRLITPV